MYADNVIERGAPILITNLNKGTDTTDWVSGTGYGFYSSPYTTPIESNKFYYRRFTYKFTTTSQSPTWAVYYIRGGGEGGPEIRNPSANTEYTASVIQSPTIGPTYATVFSGQNSGTIYNGNSNAISGVTSYCKHVIHYDITELRLALIDSGITSDSDIKTWCDNNLPYVKCGTYIAVNLDGTVTPYCTSSLKAITPFHLGQEYITLTNLDTDSNFNKETKNSAYTPSNWGGNTGTITYYANGGWNNLPYKKTVVATGGTGGLYRKSTGSDYITITNGHRYYFSAYVKGSVAHSGSGYNVNINASDGNQYLINGSGVNVTTDWTKHSYIINYTGTTKQYGEMSIFYRGAGEEFSLCGMTVIDLTESMLNSYLSMIGKTSDSDVKSWCDSYLPYFYGTYTIGKNTENLTLATHFSSNSNYALSNYDNLTNSLTIKQLGTQSETQTFSVTKSYNGFINDKIYIREYCKADTANSFYCRYPEWGSVSITSGNYKTGYVPTSKQIGSYIGTEANTTRTHYLLYNSKDWYSYWKTNSTATISEIVDINLSSNGLYPFISLLGFNTDVTIRQWLDSYIPFFTGTKPLSSLLPSAVNIVVSRTLTTDRVKYKDGVAITNKLVESDTTNVVQHKNGIITLKKFNQTNLLTNGDFSYHSSISNVCDNSNWTFDTTDYAGNGRCSLVQPVGADGSCLKYKIPIDPSSQYRISLWIKCTADTSKDTRICIYYYTSSGILLSRGNVVYDVGPTKITSDLTYGATSIQVDNSSGWTTGNSPIGFRTNNCVSYNNFNGSSNYQIGDYSSSIISSVETGKINLSSAYIWSTVPAGSYIVRNTNGSWHNYLWFQNSMPTNNTWKYLSTTFGRTGVGWRGQGDWGNGIPVDTSYAILSLSMYKNNFTTPIKFSDIRIERVSGNGARKSKVVSIPTSS